MPMVLLSRVLPSIVFAGAALAQVAGLTLDGQALFIQFTRCGIFLPIALKVAQPDRAIRDPDPIARPFGKRTRPPCVRCATSAFSIRLSHSNRDINGGLIGCSN